MASGAPPQVRPAGEAVDLSFPWAVPFDTDLYDAPAGNTAAVVTLVVDADRPNILGQIHCGYDGTPAAGTTIKIEDVSGTVVWQMPITAAGPHEFNFNPPRHNAAKNTQLIITLAAAGGTVKGYLAVNAWKME